MKFFRICPSLKSVALAAMLICGAAANAAVIEHAADRIIINVDQMDLNGDETLLDVIMMMPDVMSVDGRQLISGGMQKRMFGQYAVRVDNLDIDVSPEMFLKNTKAREIQKIKMVINPGVQKGCGGLKQVIDVYYLKGENGNTGKVTAEADSYGKGEIWAVDKKATDNYLLHTYAIGALENRKHDCVEPNCGSVNEHGVGGSVRSHFNWNITDKDNNITTASINYTRDRKIGEEPTFYRTYQFDDCYTRDLGNGAYALFQIGLDYNHSNEMGRHAKSTNPTAVVELGAPFISKNLYLNGGFEGGYSASTRGFTVPGSEELTERSSYENIYAQLDWNCGKFNFSVGDRVCFSTVYRDKVYAQSKWNHTAVTNHFTATSWVNINEHNTIQGTFARRFYGPHIPEEIRLIGDVNGEDVTESPIYTAEMRYTYQKKDFNVMGIVKNVHVNNYNKEFCSDIDHDNILQLGATAFWHKGALRITAGFDYNWQKSNFVDGVKYNNFVNLKLAPQVSICDGWRFTSLMLYNSRKAYESETYTPANFYADLGASKEFGEKWLVEAKFHDMVGQHTGNRGVSVGATYYFGK